MEIELNCSGVVTPPKDGPFGETKPLYNYGIQTEETDIRAHVGVLAQRVFVFPTRPALAIMTKYPKGKAYQPGVYGPTAEGYIVPYKEIPHLREIFVAKEWFYGFEETLSTEEKGRRACDIVLEMLRSGKFPMWFRGELINDLKLQVQGVDIAVNARVRIQTKCDFKAGSGHPLCTGNIFLQVSERNPLHKY